MIFLVATATSYFVPKMDTIIDSNSLEMDRSVLTNFDYSQQHTSMNIDNGLYLLQQVNTYNNMKVALYKEVNDYIDMANSETFISDYYKEIKSLDFLNKIRKREDYDKWFTAFENQSKSHTTAKVTMIFSLAQFPHSKIKSFETDFILKALEDYNNDIVYYSLVAIENWDIEELNEIAYNKNYNNNYLKNIAKGLKD